jgi:hypothetical protein
MYPPAMSQAPPFETESSSFDRWTGAAAIAAGIGGAAFLSFVVRLELLRR